MDESTSERTDFIPYPTNRVVGTVADPETTQAAIAALLQAGFNRDDVDILHGEKDLHRLDATGAEHGLFAQLQRTLIRTFDLEQFTHLTHHLEDVRAGRFVIMVRTKRRAQRLLAADVLNRCGAEFVGFYGRWALEDLSATAHAAPEDIPALFARAWNDRNPDALALLFDEDADFVNVAGLCWHDRESIRKAHTDGLERIFGTCTLSTYATKVKRLSPDIAVVHAQMTVGAAGPGGTVTPPGPRSTIVTFVVHRSGERWLCASVHHTDVLQDPAAAPAVFAHDELPSTPER